MPNWCNNHLTLTHEDPAMIKRAFDAIERCELLHEFIPVPQELKDTVSGSYGDPAEQAKLEAQQASNIKKYGYATWYDFCVNEWGTKWDIGEQGNSEVHPDGKTLVTGFDSAWSPPIGAYEKLLGLGFGVKAFYYEPGMNFAGGWEDGVDDHHSLDGLNSKTVRASVGDELDDIFAIGESMAEYEAENEEEEELTEWIKDGIEANKTSEA